MRLFLLQRFHVNVLSSHVFLNSNHSAALSQNHDLTQKDIWLPDAKFREQFPKPLVGKMIELVCVILAGVAIIVAIYQVYVAVQQLNQARRDRSKW